MSEYKSDDKKYILFDSIMNHKDINIFEDIIKTSYQFELYPEFEKMTAKVIDKKTKKKSKTKKK